MSSSSISASHSFIMTGTTATMTSSSFSSRSDDYQDVDSLPSISSDILDSDSDLDDDESESDAQAEWEASLEQLELLLTMVLIPFLGKFLGRKFAYWSWARYMEWMHNVEIRWTSKKTFAAAGAVEAAASI